MCLEDACEVRGRTYRTRNTHKAHKAHVRDALVVLLVRLVAPISSQLPLLHLCECGRGGGGIRVGNW